MSRLSKADALAAGRAIVERSAADETEVVIDSIQETFARFADVGPTQSADRSRLDVGIRVRLGSEKRGYREAKAGCGNLDDATIERALLRALAMAEASPTIVGVPALGGPVDVPDTAPDEATLAHGFEEKARWISEALAACAPHGFQPAGLIQTSGLARAIVGSRGRAVYGARSRASFSLTVSGAGGSGWAQRISDRVDALDPAAVVERAVGKAKLSQNPRAVEPGEYTVVLEPAAVSAMLLFAAYQGFGAREVEEQASFLCGRMGRRVFSDCLSIRDDARNDVYATLPFDGEGTPKRAHVLVEAGKLGRPVTDRLYAAKAGEESTGHAHCQPDPDGPKAGSLFVAPGDSSLGELVAGVERGLLVTQFHYTNLIEPRELMLTGMTRNGTFLIEDGRLVGAVKNLRFTQSLVAALGRVTGVGSELEVAGALFDGEVVTPALRIDGFRFTSSSDC